MKYTLLTWDYQVNYDSWQSAIANSNRENVEATSLSDLALSAGYSDAASWAILNKDGEAVMLGGMIHTEIE